MWDKRFWPLISIGSVLGVLCLSDYLLVSDELFLNEFSKSFTSEQLREMLGQRDNLKWLGYLILPLYYLLKFLLVTCCLSISVFFITDKFEFKRMVYITGKSELVFLVSAIIKLLWFFLIQTSYTLRDLQYFYPLSVLSMFNPNSLEPWLIYPFQVMNLFEVIYWVVLAHLLSKEIPELDMNRSMAAVMSGYGTGLVIWIALVMFLTITYT